MALSLSRLTTCSGKTATIVGGRRSDELSLSGKRETGTLYYSSAEGGHAASAKEACQDISVGNSGQQKLLAWAAFDRSGADTTIDQDVGAYCINIGRILNLH